MRCSSALQSDPCNHWHLTAGNKASKVKQLKAKNRKLNNKNMASATNNARTINNNVVDARFKLMQKALAKPIDARQKLTKQKDAREIIEDRRLHSLSYDSISNASRGNFRNLSQVKIDRRGVLTVKSILDKKSNSHRTSFRDRRSTLNEGRFNGVDRKGEWPIEVIRPKKYEPKVSRRLESNYQSLKHSTRPSRVNEKPYIKPMAMDDNTLDRNSRYHRGLSKTPDSHLYSHQTSSIKQLPSRGYKIVVSNLESSVTNEDINELFADMGVILKYGVVQPGIAEVIYERRADAINAVDVYHNRLLDGRPMKCDLVRGPDSSTETIFTHEPTHRMASPIAKVYESSKHVPYDIDAVYTALFY